MQVYELMIIFGGDLDEAFRFGREHLVRSLAPEPDPQRDR